LFSLVTVRQNNTAAENGNMADKREKAREVIRQMLAPEHVPGMENAPQDGRFAPEFSRLAFENAYMQLWTRDGLSLKERSLLTLGILIGLGNEAELRSHFASAMRNGLTREQLEEIIYHSTAYAGFPRAASARAAASALFEEPNR
jgi:4-carboxymuconolactone decarboxylase